MEDKKKGGSAMEVEFGGNTGENKEETNTSALQAQIKDLEARIRKAEEKGHYDYATTLHREKLMLMEDIRRHMSPSAPSSVPSSELCPFPSCDGQFSSVDQVRLHVQRDHGKLALRYFEILQDRKCPTTQTAQIMSQMEVETDVKEDDNPEGGSAMDVEHDNSEEKPTRQKTPHDKCTRTRVELKEEGLRLFADCPNCKDEGVLCMVSKHPQTAQSAPSSVPSSAVLEALAEQKRQTELLKRAVKIFQECIMLDISSSDVFSKFHLLEQLGHEWRGNSANQTVTLFDIQPSNSSKKRKLRHVAKPRRVATSR